MLCARKPHPQDGRWSWLVCFSATMCWTAVMGLIFSFGVFFPVFMKVFNEDRERTAWVGSLAIAILFFTGPLSAILVNRFGCRVTTLLGSVLCTISLLTVPLSKKLWALFCTYSIPFGVGTSFVFNACLVVVTKYFTKRRSLATGFVSVGQGLGVLMYGPLLQALIDAYGWKITFRIIAAGVFTMCLLALTFDSNIESDSKMPGTLITEEQQRQRPAKNHFALDVSVWKEPAFVAITVSASLAQFSHYAPQIHLIQFSEEIGLTADRASTLYIYLGLCSACSRTITGQICDIRGVNPFYLYQTAEILLGISIILVTLSSSYTTMVVFVVIYGLCDGTFITTLNVVLLTRVEEKKRAASLGWQMIFSSVFQASGPPIAGLMADKMGSYNGAFYMAGSVVIAGAVIPFVLLCLKKNEPMHTRQEFEHDLPAKSTETELKENYDNSHSPTMSFERRVSITTHL